MNMATTKQYMQSEDERLRSFTSSWPLPTNFKRKLAEAGFYAKGHDDETECFTCGIVLTDWKVEDDPCRRHLQANPSCTFIKERESF